MMMIDGMMKEDVKVKHHGKWHKDKSIKEEITMIAMMINPLEK
jgi:hypothetical protein